MDRRRHGRGRRDRDCSGQFGFIVDLQPVTDPSVQGGFLRSRLFFVVGALLFLAGYPLFPATTASHAAAPEDDPAVPAILDRAESLFQSMKARDFPAIFAALSAKSRETIVAETASALAAAGKQSRPEGPTAVDPPTAPAENFPPGPEAVLSDFVAGGPIARDYWDAFLRRFDPDAALEHSRWEIGSVGKDRAEILLTHHRADHPAKLKMFLEDGGWKVGLVETFWSR
jgi:hypothetical protein